MTTNTSGVRVVVDRLPQVNASLRQLALERVLVGAPGQTAERNNDEPGPINNPTLLYIHETGSPEQNIPARPTLEPGVRDVRDAIADRFQKVGEAVLSGRDVNVEQQLHAVGLMAQNAVRARFGGADLAPLSPVTLERRKARGRTGEAPLIDTGQLRNAVTYVVVRGRT